jgi:hypothetical protein
MRLPRRGAPFTGLIAATTSAGINPAMAAARVRALMAARWTPTVEDDFPSPTIETRWLATSSAESVGFPSWSQNARNISRAWLQARRLSSEATLSNTRLTSRPTRSCRRSPGCVTGIRAVGFTRNAAKIFMFILQKCFSCGQNRCQSGLGAVRV